MKLLFLSTLCVLFATGTCSAVAEKIKIPVGTQSAETQVRPQMGTTKAQVKTKFGEPIKENPAKGTPPISNWEYPEFIVYFEHNHVIHSVAKPKLQEDKETVIETTDEMSEDDFKLDKEKK